MDFVAGPTPIRSVKCEAMAIFYTHYGGFKTS